MTQYIFRVGAVLLILWLLLLVSSAFAAHPPEHQAIHEQFYQGWMMPDDRTRSCCSDKDCAPVDAVRQDESGRWQARRESDGQWLTIPPQKIEYDRDSPDGRSHMCSAGRTVFCFILGNGS